MHLCIYAFRYQIVSEITDLIEKLFSAIWMSGSTTVDQDDRILLNCSATDTEDIDWFFKGNKISTNPDGRVSEDNIHLNLQSKISKHKNENTDTINGHFTY